MTSSVANIVEKWDFSHQKYQHVHPAEKPKDVINNECFCFEKYNVSDDPNMGKNILKSHFSDFTILKILINIDRPAIDKNFLLSMDH